MTTISFKVSEGEARRIRNLAQREKLSLSEYLRRRATGQPARVLKPELVRCPWTGAMVFKSPADQPPLTTEAVSDLLSDFP